MKNVLLKVNEILRKYRKKIIIAGTVVALGGVGVSAAGGAFLYNRMQSNIKYTQGQCEEVALKQIPGEIVKVKKDMDLEDGTFEYDFQIKDKDNMLKKITVDAASGAIVDIDHEDDDFRDHHDKNGHRKEHYNNIDRNNNENSINNNSNEGNGVVENNNEPSQDTQSQSN
ncbi:PepSY domain-containing protein [Clostridium sp. LIBA-8841]|uniref:PepSY domain-containing protein n=1 Tax=Clostridium sp. LIBA-8841 TaxID=2987530 RepID=UPI002AC7B2A6|nr:PepSY domain-containing protein [Clostridium sp. LIBA-8841]MDZ5253556.1 PepSY domain-containing protein [Clostridium sp. LIBA-8841]